METYSKADCKVHILYLVKRVPGVSYQQLLDKCMESLYVDFFNFSDAYSELISGNLMSRELVNTGTGEVIGQSEILTITEAGDLILSDMMELINNKVIGYLNKAAEDLSKVVEVKNVVKAVTDVDSEGRIVVNMSSEGSGINLSLVVSDSSEAEIISNNWRNNSKTIINTIIQILRQNNN